MPQGRPRFYGGALVEAQQASQCVRFFLPPPRHFVSFCRHHAIFFFPRPGHRLAISFRFVSFRFISEVAPRNPGHATHFTKGNENPLGNKLGGGPSGGAHEPPPASIVNVFGGVPGNIGWLVSRTSECCPVRQQV